MGSDRKLKEKKSKKRSTYSSSSASEDEGREKRQRRGEEEEWKSRKKDSKKEKRKDKKSRKHSSDKEKKPKEKGKRKHHKGDRTLKHFQELSNDDYFSKNNEFATWLREEKHVFFSDLSSESARELFSDFVIDWNNQKLGSQYYEGIASGPRTAHNWKIKQNLLKSKLPLPTTALYTLPSLTRFQLHAIFSIQCPAKEEEEKPGNHATISLSNHPNPEISCFYQKGFSQITRETTGKALHALCIEGLVPLSVFLTNTLINMYSKFGLIDYARYLFDHLSVRNTASWNTIMSGLVRVGLYGDVMFLFCEMRRFGVWPSGFLVSSLITACDRSGCMFIEGIQVHGFVVKIGLLCDVFVGTCLLHFYGAYKRVFDAQTLFEEMPERNVVSWTSLMFGYLDNGDLENVIHLYWEMREEEISCNENTFATVLTACSLLEDESLGLHVFGHVVKSGFENKVSVANSLISMFGSLGSLKEACYVFSHMDERDTISWNSIISAHAQNELCEASLRFFRLMRHVHEKINSTTLATLLSVCSSVDHMKWGRGIHGMYSESGRLDDAEFVFKEMPERDVISWNSMITGNVRDGRSLDALILLIKMLQMKKATNYVTFTSALAACSNAEFIDEGKIVHALVILTGLHENLVVGNASVTMYAKSGMMVEAKKVFRMMPKRNEVTWNALIGGHAENEETDEAVKAFQLMRAEGIKMDYITVSNILGACLTPDDLLKLGMPIHAHVVSTGFESNKYVQNSLITMYARCGDLQSSNYIFDGLPHKNSISWNAIIAANACHGLGEEVLKHIVKMRTAGIDLDQFSFSEGLAATAKLAVLEEGQQLHCVAVKLGFDSDPFVTNAAMDMYGKCGEMDDVLRMLPQPVSRSRLSWNILISAFARHGYFQKARETFHEMLEMGMKPDHVTFVSLLSACSHGGLVDEGIRYYAAMSKEFNVPPAIEHCVCIIDLLGRSGRLAEAETFINEMPVLPDGLVWRTLLASCKIHGNLELGKKAAEHLFELDPSDDSAYVLYSNICATTGKWGDVEDVRSQMGLYNIKKKPACSWVKLKNQVGSFGMGDQTHPQTIEIYAKLGELKKMIKEAGYVPDTSYALQDTDEEQKEHNLWNHSERLALAFGLINTPDGSTIRVFKNLRVCGDCHSVYKFVSGIIKRKIILRDPYRFHHFSGGQCPDPGIDLGNRQPNLGLHCLSLALCKTNISQHTVVDSRISRRSTKVNITKGDHHMKHGFKSYNRRTVSLRTMNLLLG
ncbi:Pentatricopeptide repeat - like 10 [Theobroma cacao]|nr:Pentatricopeptide repeat - like 10 [Theobroma cacao]